MNTQADRLLDLRRRSGLNQTEVAEKVGVTYTRIGEYERNPNVRIKMHVLKALAKVYNTSVEYIEKGVGSAYVENNEINKMPPRVIVVDQSNREKIVFVPIKAQAGYPKHYADPEYLTSFQTYSIPGYENGTYRIFEVEGHSMTKPENPEGSIVPGDKLICSYVENFTDIKDNGIYVVVTKDGICVKRCINRIEDRKGIVIESDNPEYRPDFIPAAEILEMWEYKAKITKS
jgi:transcriptional regulator with XRE-family HTH domain